MKQETLQKLRNTQMKMALELKRICEKNHIPYFMDAGTLIGAVRHKGFIPWDDDMDFGMLREDYERFLKVAPQELDENYFLQTWESDSYYGLPFAKIRKKNTVYMEEAARKTKADSGIFVDIFPYDFYNEESKKDAKKRMLLKMLIKVKLHYRPWVMGGGVNAQRYVLYLPIRFISLFCRVSSLKQRYEAIVQKNNQAGGTQLYQQLGENTSDWIIEKRFFNQFMILPFEDESFMAPVAYHDYLTMIYGDYMTPPPEDKRESTHGVIEISFE